jgi:ABC-type bacteriocin/lantibiotic exporter with double-glycine peptidase domain
MKQKIKSFMSTFKEMWQYSRESTEIVRRFSPLIPTLAFSALIIDSLKTFGLLAFAGLFWGYAEKQGFSIKQNVVIVFWIYITFTIVGVCLTNIFRVYLTRRKNAFEYFIEDHFTTLEHDKLMTVGVANRISGAFTKIARRVSSDQMKNVTGEFFKFKGKVISATIAVVITMTALTFVNIWMVLCISFVALLSVKRRVRRYRRVYDTTDQKNKLRNRSGEYETVVTRQSVYIQNFFFGTIPYFMEQYLQKRSEYRTMNDQEEMEEVKSDVFVSIMRVLPVLVFAFSVYNYIQKGDVQNILILLGCYKSLENSIHTFFRLYSDYDEELLQMRDWKEFLVFEPSIDETSCTEYQPSSVPNISLKEVTFTYPETPNPALVNINLLIPKSQCVALIGNNGSGKSTLISLLTKVRLPQKGDVYFDSVRTRDVTQLSIAKHVCWIAGNCDLLELPLYEAVCGCSLEDVDWTRLEKASNITGANQYVTKLSHGWYTSLDTTDEHHTEGFSDGQKQRLNLTAALYRALSPEVHVVIFDEPMAHCDTDVKTLFYQEIQKLGKTVIAAIHDPGYLILFQRVIKLEDGQVVSDILN